MFPAGLLDDFSGIHYTSVVGSKRYCRLLILLLVLFFSVPWMVLGQESGYEYSRGYDKGPLQGKTNYIPLFLYYNFPNFTARSVKKGTLQYRSALYYTNDFRLIDPWSPEPNTIGTDGWGFPYPVFVFRDYESCIEEIGVSYSFIDGLALGIDLRVISYYGGFLDSVVEAFHSWFGFSNGGREYLSQDPVPIDIYTGQGMHLYLTDNTVAVTDTDLWAHYSVYDSDGVSIALMGAVTIPTGSLSTLSGSGFPDFALGVLGDFRPHWICTLYLQAGIVLPLDAVVPAIPTSPNPMFNGMIGFELNPTELFSITAQFNIRTSPITSSGEHLYYQFQGEDFLARPQINTLVGIVFFYDDMRWQLYVEENTFTNAGADITINLQFSQSIDLEN